MNKQFISYSLIFILTSILCLPSIAANTFREKVNNHLNEASHEFLDDKDTMEAAKELRLTADVLRNETNAPNSKYQKSKLDKSVNKLETIANKMETGGAVNVKEFNDAVKCTKDSLKVK